MSLFDLLFIAIVVASLVTIAAGVGFLWSGRRDRGIAILRNWALLFGGYGLVVTLVSLILPRNILSIGDPLCFDDWCVTVVDIRSGSGSAEVTYRLSNVARGVRQRENNFSTYLIDKEGNRRDPDPSLPTVPFNTLLSPGESLIARRDFILEDGFEPIGVVMTHEGGFPIGWFILGEGILRKPPMVRLRNP